MVDAVVEPQRPVGGAGAGGQIHGGSAPAPPAEPSGVPIPVSLRSIAYSAVASPPRLWP